LDTPNDSYRTAAGAFVRDRATDAEAALVAARQQLQYLLSATPVMLYTRMAAHPLALTFLGANTAERLGFEATALLKSPELWSDRIHPEDAKAAHLCLEQVLVQGARTCEYRFRHADGRWLWLHDEARLVLNPCTRELEVVGCLLEVTERRDAEAELAARAAQLAEAQAVAHVGSFDWDIASDRISWSDEHYRIFGLTPGECDIDYEVFLRLLHPDDHLKYRQAVRTAFEAVRPYHVMLRIVRPDGGERVVLSRAVVTRDESGQPVRMHGTTQDITELARTGEALRMSEERFSAFMQHLPGAAFIRDRSGRYLYANPNVAAPGEPQGKTLTDVFPADTARALHANDLYVFDTGKALHTIETTASANGKEPRHWLVTKFPLWQGPGEESLLGGIGIDVTERVHAEEELRRSELQLRRMLEERARLSQDLHDGIIQTAYAVGMHLEECQRMIQEADGGSAQRTLEAAIETLNGAIRDIRRFITAPGSAVESDGGIATSLQELGRTLEAARVLRVDVDVDPAVAAKLTPDESHHLLCIAREALSNSMRHARAGRASIGLKRLRGKIRFEARDDGVGFEPDKLPLRGQGLRNINARASLMGARLKLESAPGAGTRIVLHLLKEWG
jgi:PAS domain S-box-containing protein